MGSVLIDSLKWSSRLYPKRRRSSLYGPLIKLCVLSIGRNCHTLRFVESESVLNWLNDLVQSCCEKREKTCDLEVGDLR